MTRLVENAQGAAQEKRRETGSGVSEHHAGAERETGFDFPVCRYKQGGFMRFVPV